MLFLFRWGWFIVGDEAEAEAEDNAGGRGWLKPVREWTGDGRPCPKSQLHLQRLSRGRSRAVAPRNSRTVLTQPQTASFVRCDADSLL